MVSSSVRRSVRLTNRVRGGSLSVGLLDWRKGSEFGSFTCLIRITVFCMLPKATFFESYDLDLLVRNIRGMCGSSTVSTVWTFSLSSENSSSCSKIVQAPMFKSM